MCTTENKENPIKRSQVHVWIGVICLKKKLFTYILNTFFQRTFFIFLITFLSHIYHFAKGVSQIYFLSHKYRIAELAMIIILNNISNNFLSNHT